MILTTSYDSSKKLNREHVKLLREKCDDINTFSECGWFCVAGYRGTQRLVYAHCNSQAEYETAMGLRRAGRNHYDPKAHGKAEYLIKATATYKIDGEKTDECVTFFSSEDPYSDRERLLEMSEEALRDANDGETRSIRLTREYWDQIPRSERVVGVNEDNARTVRY
ncbi:hypothetical protein G6L37_03455 [Agrobacterium rubi]|nr:hypothetical protein [Agrobacterium rubi]NTF24428.1 hypothetical protein [Agrobacterium rubi]